MPSLSGSSNGSSNSSQQLLKFTPFNDKYTFLPADNRAVPKPIDLHVHGARLAPRNRIFINLRRPNAENVEVTIYGHVFIAGPPFLFLQSSTPSSGVRAEPLISLSVTFVRESQRVLIHFANNC